MLCLYGVLWCFLFFFCLLKCAEYSFFFTKLVQQRSIYFFFLRRFHFNFYNKKNLHSSSQFELVVDSRKSNVHIALYSGSHMHNTGILWSLMVLKTPFYWVKDGAGSRSALVWSKRLVPWNLDIRSSTVYLCVYTQLQCKGKNVFCQWSEFNNNCRVH